MAFLAGRNVASFGEAGAIRGGEWLCLVGRSGRLGPQARSGYKDFRNMVPMPWYRSPAKSASRGRILPRGLVCRL